MEFINITLRFWMFLLVLCLCRMSDGNVADNVIPEHAELLKSIKYYETVNPYRMEEKAKRRASTRLLNQENDHVESTTLVFNGTKYQFTLDITLNKGLFSPEYKETHVLGNGARTFNQKLDHCFYHGRVREDDKSTVSLSTCNGIEGIITTSEGTYFIHPLKSKAKNVVEEHVVYRSDDVDKKPMTCGQSHIISPKEEFHYLKEAANLKARVRRDIKSETKYLELFIINDRAQYRRYKNGTELRAKQLVNHLDSIYRVHKVRIVLVLVETWRERNLIVIAKRANDTLYNLLKYKNENLDKDKGKHWDNIQLLSGTDFEGSTVGFAPIRSICGRRSAAVVQDSNSDPAATASTMAHELGHNLGMTHDKLSCECPIENRKCIMHPTITGIVTQFSTCSVNELEETLEKGFGTCLFDKPTKIYGPAICGNGFVEEGEQCDCGKKEECEHENKCCNATTCMLQPGAACSHGECCDNCQFRSRGVLCRKKHDECDLPEFCTGENELCPEDTYVHDGIPCSNNEGCCYNAVCRSIKLQCQYLFGKDMLSEGHISEKNIKSGQLFVIDVDVAVDLCYNRNAGKDNRYYGCYSEALGGHTCALRDVKCGRITCKSYKQMYPIVGQDRGFSSVTYDGKTFCLSPTLTHGDGENYEYAQEGTKCGTDKMCKDAKCIPVTEAVPVSAYDRCPNNCSGNGICLNNTCVDVDVAIEQPKCTSNCSGNGICNNLGHCHCFYGYRCPDCIETCSVEGGSVDSGNGCDCPDRNGTINTTVSPTNSPLTTKGRTKGGTKGGTSASRDAGTIAAAVLVPFGVLVVVFFAIRYRNEIATRFRSIRQPAQNSLSAVVYGGERGAVTFGKENLTDLPHSRPTSLNILGARSNEIVITPDRTPDTKYKGLLTTPVTGTKTASESKPVGSGMAASKLSPDRRNPPRFPTRPKSLPDLLDGRPSNERPPVPPPLSNKEQSFNAVDKPVRPKVPKVPTRPSRQGSNIERRTKANIMRPLSRSGKDSGASPSDPFNRSALRKTRGNPKLDSEVRPPSEASPTDGNRCPMEHAFRPSDIKAGKSPFGSFEKL